MEGLDSSAESPKKVGTPRGGEEVNLGGVDDATESGGAEDSVGRGCDGSSKIETGLEYSAVGSLGGTAKSVVILGRRGGPFADTPGTVPVPIGEEDLFGLSKEKGRLAIGPSFEFPVCFCSFGGV
jgi:hypothetical protein